MNQESQGKASFVSIGQRTYAVRSDLGGLLFEYLGNPFLKAVFQAGLITLLLVMAFAISTGYRPGEILYLPVFFLLTWIIVTRQARRLTSFARPDYQDVAEALNGNPRSFHIPAEAVAEWRRGHPVHLTLRQPVRGKTRLKLRKFGRPATPVADVVDYALSKDIVQAASDAHPASPPPVAGDNP